MAAASSPQAAPPTPQEVSRKLSISQRSPRPNSKKKPTINIPQSGTESDSDTYSQNQLSPDASTSFFPVTTGVDGLRQKHLSAIDEKDSDEDEDDEEVETHGTRRELVKKIQPHQNEETVVKAGYLEKKGERRKTWKRRWFVLRPSHLALYKDHSEYKIVRLIDLNDIHSIQPCSFKRHDYTFGLVTRDRNFWLQAGSQKEVDDWVRLLREYREHLISTSTIRGEEGQATPPIPIPQVHDAGSSSGVPASSPLSSRRSQSPRYITSSEDEDPYNTSSNQQGQSFSTMGSGIVPPTAPSALASPVGKTGQGHAQASSQASKEKDPSKPILTGYLMKNKGKKWKKRWFVLTGEKFYYCGSHMDTKPRREFPLDYLVDALEGVSTVNAGGPTFTHGHGHGQHHGAGHPMTGGGDDTGGNERHGYVFKVVTTKETLNLSAPSEGEEIKWISGVRAVIARRNGLNPGNSNHNNTTHNGQNNVVHGSKIGVAE